jgi:2,3-bisphosphoglycerate-independent phosphoglycerate mutase
LAKKNKIPKVAIHVFTDGRDTAPQSASTYVKELEAVLDILNDDTSKPDFFIATISGRYYAMDRDNNWDRLAKTEQALFECKGNVCEIKPSDYLSQQYKKGERDELLPPTVCATPEGTGCAIEDGDAVFFFNFRADRARMLSERMLKLPASKHILFATLTEYCVDFTCPIAFPPFKIETSIGQEVANAGLSQARIAETEKFAHATYFLNGGREAKFDKETDVMIPSRKDIKTHDEAPEMRAEGIADAMIAEIKKGTDFIFVNFANADMVGHTANVPAIIKAVETVDSQLKRVVEALTAAGGIALITADHGNAEINIDPVTSTKHTAHTTSPVPCIITSHEFKLRDGALFDLAPTVLKLLDTKKPASMVGSSLV